MDFVQQIVETYYPADDALRQLLLRHSGDVSARAVAVCEAHPELGADAGFVRAAAMLHDIGIVRCDAPSLGCHGPLPYLQHGQAGAQMLRDISPDLEPYARVCERHTGTGLPGYEPQTIEEQIVCYADKFYSKSSPDRVKTYEQACHSLRKFGLPGLKKFEAWHEKFGSILLL